MKYAVHVVADHELPEGIERIIVERPDRTPLLLLAESAARTWRFICEWEASQDTEWSAEPLTLRAV